MRDLKWTTPALLDFEEIQNHIEKDNPLAAQRVAIRIRKTAATLQAHPFSGRSFSANLRVCVVSGTPYLLVYRVMTDVEVIRVWHGRRDWMNFQLD